MLAWRESQRVPDRHCDYALFPNQYATRLGSIQHILVPRYELPREKYALLRRHVRPSTLAHAAGVVQGLRRVDGEIRDQSVRLHAINGSLPVRPASLHRDTQADVNLSRD